MAELRPFVQTFKPANALMEKEQFEQQRAQAGRKAQRFELGKEDRLRDIQYEAQDRATAEQQRKLEQTAKALDAALKAQDPKMQKQIYDYFKAEGEDTPEFEFKGGKMVIRYPDGEEISGPKEVLTEFTSKVVEDPTWLSDPNKLKHTVAWLTAKGGSIKFPEAGAGAGIGNTEKERTWLRETGGKTPMSVWEINNTIREIKAKQKAGYIAPIDRIEWQNYSRDYNTLRKKIRDAESKLAGLSEDNEYVKGQKSKIEEMKMEAAALKKLMDTIIPPTEPRRGAGEIKIPKATLEYWKKRGKTEEEIYREWEKVHGKNPPKIGY